MPRDPRPRREPEHHYRRFVSGWSWRPRRACPPNAPSQSPPAAPNRRETCNAQCASLCPLVHSHRCGCGPGEPLYRDRRPSMRKSVTFRQLFLVICDTGGGRFPCAKTVNWPAHLPPDTGAVQPHQPGRHLHDPAGRRVSRSPVPLTTSGSTTHWCSAAVSPPPTPRSTSSTPS